MASASDASPIQANMDSFKVKSLDIDFPSTQESDKFQAHWANACDAIVIHAQSGNAIVVQLKMLYEDLLVLDTASTRSLYLDARAKLRKKFAEAFKIAHPELCGEILATRSAEFVAKSCKATSKALSGACCNNGSLTTMTTTTRPFHFHSCSSQG